ncbi:MAG: cysteine--tRNA ligase [Planctomycetota bacterium]|nr:cysteine--tRNA ligase [Planctomycetota bacterium]
MTSLLLFDTLTRQKQDLGPPGQAPVRFYSCGPTVYNRVHVGNLRAFLFYDVLRRALLWLGYPVRHVMNLTDVDDKTIKGSRAESVSLRAFTERYTELFLKDMDALGALRPDVMPRATDYVPQMVDLVQRLLDKGVAYRSEDGSVYFKIGAFPGYGRLSHLEARTLQAGAGGRVAQDEYEKEDVQDFALWKAWSEEDGDVAWDTALGKGRPGWHLECSALAFEHLGESLDIHAGGVDLVFPHHENEIAQSEAASGKTFSRLWVHNEHLLVGGQKMAKRLKNFFTLGDLVQLAGATPREVRYALISAHYRSQLNLQVTYEGEGEARRPVRFDSLEVARGALRRLDQFRKDLLAKATGQTPAGAAERLARAKDEYREAVRDDLNVPRALGVLFELVTDVNKLGAWDAAYAQEVQAFLDDADRVLGVLTPEPEALSPEEQALFERWKAAREAKDWAAADAARAGLQAKGIQVQARKGAEPTWARG